jgi:hypothetical protein
MQSTVSHNRQTRSLTLSPRRNGIVPSLAIGTPSTDKSTSSGAKNPWAAAVGGTS